MQPDEPILTMRDQEIRSATFDAHRRLLSVLGNERLAMLSFGPRELSDAVEDRLNFCLSVEERQRVLNEYEWFATRRAKACE